MSIYQRLWRWPRLARFVTVSVLVGGSAPSCTGTPAAPSGPVDQQVIVPVGGTMRVPEAGLRFHFDAVVSDNRCPADVNCVTAGEAVVTLVVLPDSGASARYTLSTGSATSVRHRAITVELVELAPYPFRTRPIAPSTYAITLRIRR